VDALESKKGEDILLLDMKEVSDFANYFIICSASSVRMLDALAEEVTKKIKQNHRQKVKSDGSPYDGWQVIDAGEIIVHLFTPDQREYYKLEELWGEAKVLLHLQ
jgi:ribosome-associated protein